MGENFLLPAFFQTVTIAFDVDRDTVVQNPIQNGCSDHIVGKDLTPPATRLKGIFAS